MATLFPPNLCTSVMSAETLLKEEGGGSLQKILQIHRPGELTY